jgi:hypothetical protein
VAVRDQVPFRRPARIAADRRAWERPEPSVQKRDRDSRWTIRAALELEGDLLPVRRPARRRGRGEVRRGSQHAEAGAVGSDERETRCAGRRQRGGRSALCRLGAALPAVAADERSSRNAGCDRERAGCDRERQCHPDHQASQCPRFRRVEQERSSRPVRGRCRDPRSSMCPTQSPPSSRSPPQRARPGHPAPSRPCTCRSRRCPNALSCPREACR